MPTQVQRRRTHLLREMVSVVVVGRDVNDQCARQDPCLERDVPSLANKGPHRKPLAEPESQRGSETAEFST